MDTAIEKFDLSSLSGKRLFIATPTYGGQCSTYYLTSMCSLFQICSSASVKIELHCIINESLIPRARNSSVAAFMKSSCDAMLFIDSDIQFNPLNVLELFKLHLLDGYEIIGGSYPKKALNWSRIRDVVKKFPEVSMEDLPKFGSNYVINVTRRKNEFGLNEVTEVDELGTGFLMIGRATFQKYMETYPESKYQSDDPSESADPVRWMFFNSEIDPETKRYLSEDYFFCKRAQAFGTRIWFCPWISLNHVGNFVFHGDMSVHAKLPA